MRALAIETSSSVGSLALAEDGEVLAEDQFAHGLVHAAEMLPRIDRLCRDRGWGPGDLRDIYVSAGPGSFTGLRIGITLAKTLAFATRARIVAVPSVEVLAQNARAEAQHVLIVLDAKRDQIFTARMSRANGTGTWIYDEPAHLDALADALARAPRPIYLIGEGIPAHERFLPPQDIGVIITPQELWRPRARGVALLGARWSATGRFTEPDRLVPIYIRKPEAEEKWEQQHGGERPNG